MVVRLNQKPSIKTLLIQLILVVIFMLRINYTASGAVVNSQWSDIISKINITRIEEHARYLSSLPTRVPGSEGYDLAAKYVEETLRSYGLKVQVEYYNATILKDYGSSLTIYTQGVEEKIQCYALRPNGVETCTTPENGITGPLVYAGKLSSDDLQNKNFKDAIALVEFNVKYDWAELVKLGVKAIVFIEPEQYTLDEITQKAFYILPIDIPRIIISRDKGLELKDRIENGEEITATVRVKMEYENGIIKNIIGEVPGKVNDEAILFSTHFDSQTLIPSLSPGASEAVSVGVFLELAKFVSEINPYRRVIFAAFSGHGVGYSCFGARAYVNEHFDDLGSIKVVMSIDVSGYKNLISVYDAGNLYYFQQQRISRRIEFLVDEIKTILNQMSSELGEEYILEYDEYILEKHGGLSYSEHEVFTIYGGIGFSITDRMNEDIRSTYATPSDTLENLDLRKNYKPIHATFAIAFRLATWEDLPNRVEGPYRLSGHFGFATLIGRVSMYNPSNDSYVPVPNSLVMIAESSRTGEAQVFTLFFEIVKTDDKGFFKTYGLQPETENFYAVMAFTDDPSEGPPEYAVDIAGVNSLTRIIFSMKSPTHRIEVNVFRAGYVLFYECLDPNERRIQYASLQVQPLEYPTHNMMLPHIGFLNEGHPNLPTWTMLMLVPGKKYEFMFLKFVPSLQISGILNNATVDNPNGYGYLIEDAKILMFQQQELEIARNLKYIVLNRLEVCNKSKLYAPMVYLYVQNGEKYEEIAVEDWKRGDYIMHRIDAKTAWGFYINAYLEVMKVLKGATSSSFTFLFFLLPFAVVLERLLFEHEKTMKALQTISVIFAIFMGLMYVIHPGFRIAPNLGMNILVFSMSLFSIVALILMVGELIALIREKRESKMGIHASEISRLGALMAAFILGIRNMKKRRLRSALTIISIMVVTGALVSSVSISTAFLPSYITGTQRKIPYNGFLIRGEQWNPLSRKFYETIGKYEIVQNIGFTVWAYPVGTGEIDFIVEKTGEKYGINALWGVTPWEGEASGVAATVVKGSWLEEDDYRACILSKALSESLEIDIGDTINIYGISFHVKGIIDDQNLIQLVDFDGYPKRPAHLSVGIGGRVTAREEEFLLPENVIIIHAETAYQLGGMIVKVYIKAKPNVTVEAMRESALDMAFRYKMHVYMGFNNTVEEYSPKFKQMTLGLPMLIVLMGILIITVLNTMITAVYERKSEIFTYSSVGLSPTHVSGLFIAEAVTVGLVGGMLGYILGTGLHIIFDALNILQTLHPNFTSGWIPGSMLIVLLTTLASTLYPMRVASKLVTPGVMRKWKIPPPKGDEWFIPLPFAPAKIEVDGLMNYIYEYLEVHRTEKEEKFTSDKLWMEEKKTETERIKTIVAHTRHRPWDQGIMNIIKINARIPKEGTCSMDIYVKRLGGLTSPWKHAVREFADEIRKQCLVWRSLTPEQKSRYTGVVYKVKREKTESK